MTVRALIVRIISQATAVAFTIIFLFSSLLSSESAYAMDIKDVTSPGGIKAWLVEEHGLPLVAVRFGFSGGSSQDPEGKEGVANLLTVMLDEGAGDLKSQAFQEKMEELAIKMSFEASRDNVSGSFQSLTENLDEAIALFKLAITKPRFDADAIERMRGQIATGLAFDAKDPNKVAAKAWYKTAFEGHPYARPSKGTVESLKTITAEDLEAYRSKNFAKDTLRVTVVGDVTPEQLGPILDRMFGDLPEKSATREIPPLVFNDKGRTEIIKMNVPQSVAQFGHAAFPRNDKDFIASYVLNYIIGGGGFNSRLMEEVREKAWPCLFSLQLCRSAEAHRDLPWRRCDKE